MIRHLAVERFAVRPTPPDVAEPLPRGWRSSGGLPGRALRFVPNGKHKARVVVRPAGGGWRAVLIDSNGARTVAVGDGRGDVIFAVERERRRAS